MRVWLLQERRRRRLLGEEAGKEGARLSERIGRRASKLLDVLVPAAKDKTPAETACTIGPPLFRAARWEESRLGGRR